ncbi:MAG TPA: hypothetical protein V6D26_00020 [Stenomitos sp.]
MKKAKRLSLAQILEAHLKERPNRWLHGGDIEKLAQSWGYEAETGKRRMRELTQKNHPDYNPRIRDSYKKGSILYAYI